MWSGQITAKALDEEVGWDCTVDDDANEDEEKVKNAKTRLQYM